MGKQNKKMSKIKKIHDPLESLYLTGDTLRIFLSYLERLEKECKDKQNTENNMENYTNWRIDDFINKIERLEKERSESLEWTDYHNRFHKIKRLEAKISKYKAIVENLPDAYKISKLLKQWNVTDVLGFRYKLSRAIFGLINNVNVNDK